MEKSQTRLPFLVIMINKHGTKIWIDIYNKLTDSKRYVPFTSNHPRHCLTNENENVKEKPFKELQKTLLEQKYPKSLIEASILRAKEIPLEVLRQQQQQKKNEEIIPFTITYNPNNPNDFPLIKQGFDNFQYSKVMSNIFQRKKRVKSMSEAPNLGRLISRSKFQSHHKNHDVKNCGKN